MLQTLIAGENLSFFISQIEEQSVKKMDNIALLTEDFFNIVEKLLEKNYKIEIVAVNANSLMEDKVTHIINIKLQK